MVGSKGRNCCEETATSQPYAELANAIIVQAATDYFNSMVNIKKNFQPIVDYFYCEYPTEYLHISTKDMMNKYAKRKYNAYRAIVMFKDCEQFFADQWFEMLSSVAVERITKPIMHSAGWDVDFRAVVG